MQIRKTSSLFAHPKALSRWVFVLSFLVTQSIAWRLLVRERSLEKDRVEKAAWQFKNSLETILDNSTTATYTLAFLVQNDLLEGKFDSLSEQILKRNKYIDAIQLVEGSVIVKTYPLAGNEVVIGMDIFNSPAHRRDAEIAVQRHELYFEGPFELAQGGLGMVGRLPIVKDGKVWGFSAVVIRLKTLVIALGLDLSGITDEYFYQMVKVQDDREVKFFQNKEDFSKGLFAAEHVTLGDWDLYVKLKETNYWMYFIPFALLGLIFSLVFSVFVWKVATQPMKLQRMIDEKTEDLKRLNDDLEKRADELEHYAHVISHDLQEPLRMISNFLELLQRSTRESIDENGKEYILHSLQGADRMRQLIQDLLQYSVAGKQRGVRDKIPLRMIMDDVISLLQHQIDRSEAEIVYEDLPTIKAPKLAITQVMQNLVGNAIKYSRSEENPLICISVESHEKYWEIVVADNGVGIAEEHQQEVFDAFRRINIDDGKQGTGLGLAIVKKNIDALGGQVWVKSEVGQGSEFHFTIPRGK